ncbi:muts domain V-domain-containing protein [Mycena albidolilacea]|uniref:DNA mismatch repair protein MSH3 n=1 Tax=Mycena albidolilacea TaxID=1033008 RepID=A0AAD7EQZ3_9AGAR|nr:muts domain V-domain-containing protein [Mycena albidolilacea]
MSSGIPSSSPTRQAKISTFFSQPKRPAAALIDLTGGDSPEREEPPLKKQKNGKAERWRFHPSSSPQTVASAADSTDQPGPSKNASKDAYRKKLLSGNNTSTARKPASESKASESDSDHAFDELSAFFSAKSGKGQKKKVTRKPIEEIGPSGETYTPLENQVRRLKKENPSALLMIEVGYKYKFFGEDAKAAAKELGMVCFLDRNFLVASIPTHRRDIHLKKLLSQGYKVGIVQQVETAALKKAGDNRNAPFERKLVHLFTAATYVDDLDSIDELDKYTAPRLVCLIEGKSEKPTATGADVCIGMISVSPSVGDVVWDVFDDGAMRIELETRLVHSKPTELLLQRNGLSKSTDKMLKHFTEAPTTGTKIRTEYFKNAMPFSEAFEYVSQFYANNTKTDSGSHRNSRLLATITDFPKPVVVALACTIRYLSGFDIAATLAEATFFTKFTTSSQMNLAGNTLANLEIFQNETDYTARGSLIWILDKTVTSFGARKLRAWVGKPLVSRSELELRIEAIEEIVESSSDKLVSLRQLLKRLPDLAKGLCRIQYKQCTPRELVVLLTAFHKIGTAFAAIQTPADVNLKSTLLNEIILSLPPLKKPMGDLLDAINIKQAAEGRKDCMWRDSSKYQSVEDNILAIHQVEAELDQELSAIRKTLKMPSLGWSTVSGEEYLIEVKKSDKRRIPESFLPAVSKTKYVERYRSPGVTQKLQERARWQESLQIEAKKAFLAFLDEVAAHYAILRNAVNKLAAADCLLSLAQVALRDNYVKPQFTDDDTFEIVDGRHPMVEALRSDPYVPNSVSFESGNSKVITGPNMGGKSSCVRMIALVAIMAQIGSYVPATSVKIGMLDSILTRMGAHDDLARGRSTFMVEMTETSDILQAATSKSLVILDELGRGTSTFDGMAIAYAVLNELVASTQCKTLFITHYPLVATELEEKFPDRVQNIHVGYSTDTRGIDGRRDVTFLYRLTNGIAPESFGVECARLAGLPESILINATKESSEMELAVAARAKRKTSLKALELLKTLLQNSSLSQEQVEANVEQLRSLSPQTNVLPRNILRI